MQAQNNQNEILLPHHEQQSLCTTRLPYRQGRKLTAVKVYSISKESNHLLIFGVPSLNLRQETKTLFIKFGKLLQFNISKEHASESFTETYHAQYERIQSARIAKRMLDTKTFYGGSLHVCYAPELENVNETRQKLMQRKCDVIFRLRNINKEEKNPISTSTSNTDISILENLHNKTLKPSEIVVTEPIKLNMGVINTIYEGKQIKGSKKKRKLKNDKKFQPCFIDDKKIKTNDKKIVNDNVTECNNVTADNISNITNSNITTGNQNKDIEVIDCTGVEDEVITNINEHLNYDKFGNEIIRKVPEKPLNKIQFHLNKKT